MRTLIKSDEAEWEGPARFWASVQQFPERKRRLSSWWLVLAGVAMVAVALRWL